MYSVGVTPIGRPARIDRPGALHHVINRGSGQDPIFATEEDVGRFLSLLAFVTREGLLQVLSYAVLSTHFHLVVNSPAGRLSEALHRVGSLYALWFNRTRDLRGHTFEARFFSRLIEDEIDLAGTVTYVDGNPVAAGMAASPEQYAHGSARFYLGAPSPRWLSRDLIESLACRLARKQRFEPAAYLSIWRFASASGSSDLVQRASRSPNVKVAPLKVLIEAGPEHVQRWLLENLRRREGRATPQLVVGGEELLRRLGQEGLASLSRSAAPAAGLLYTISGWTMSEIATRYRVSQPTIHRAVADHRRRMLEDVAYRTEVARFVAATVRAVYGGFRGA
jgi:hypothetical protein